MIIGGGVGGAAIAYHLTDLGWTDVVLLDRSELTSGSTFHSAGLVGQLRSSPTLTRMMVDSVATYRGLAAETGVDPGWREVGSLRLAASAERMEELRRQAGWAKTYRAADGAGQRRARRRRLFPLDGHRRRAGRGVAADRRLPRSERPDPGARGRRSQPRGHDPAADAGDGDRRRARARDPRGDRARLDPGGGRWSTPPACSRPRSGGMAGITVPIIPFSHQYLVTEPIDGVTPDLPAAARPGQPRLLPPRGPRPGDGRLRARPAAWSLDGIPPDFNGKLLAPDWPRFEEISAGAVRRVPAMHDAGITAAHQRPRGVHPGQRVHPR